MLLWMVKLYGGLRYSRNDKTEIQVQGDSVATGPKLLSIKIMLLR
jgi:hypothetical protein